jgi:hypothetical protein
MVELVIFYQPARRRKVLCCYPSCLQLWHVSLHCIVTVRICYRAWQNSPIKTPTDFHCISGRRSDLTNESDWSATTLESSRVIAKSWNGGVGAAERIWWRKESQIYVWVDTEHPAIVAWCFSFQHLVSESSLISSPKVLGLILDRAAVEKPPPAL